jgi:hypothetical protein
LGGGAREDLILLFEQVVPLPRHMELHEFRSDEAGTNLRVIDYPGHPVVGAAPKPLAIWEFAVPQIVDATRKWGTLG